MNNFDWSLVRSFLAALDSGSLLGAARALRSSQPTIGRHISELESQLATVLFERTGRGLLPTRAALQLAPAARAMESGALALARSASGAQTEARGTVRITASVPVAVALLPALLYAMRQALPHIAIELVSSNQVSNLLRREADIAVRMVRPQQNTLIAKKIGNVALGAFAHKDYLACHPAPQTPTDLLQHQLIGSDMDTSILQGFSAMGYPVTRDIFSLRSDDFIVQWQAIRAGLGIGFAAQYMAQTDPDVIPVLHGTLKVPPLPMWLAVHREIRTNGHIRSVFDFLAQGLPKVI